MRIVARRTRNAFPVFDGRKLVALRKRRGLTLDQFVNRLQEETGDTRLLLRHDVETWEDLLPGTNIQAWIASPGISDAFAICRILRCKVEDLMSEASVYVVNFPRMAEVRQRKGITWEELARRVSEGRTYPFTARYLQELCRTVRSDFGMNNHLAALLAGVLNMKPKECFIERSSAVG